MNLKSLLVLVFTVFVTSNLIADEGDADIFVHISQVQQSGLNELQDNQKVSFDVEEGRNGKNQATNLKIV